MRRVGFLRRVRSQSGSSLIEMLVAGFISTVFLLAAGTAYLVNISSYRRNTEKLRLQQTASDVIEIMERKIRMGTKVVIAASDRIQVLDRNNVELTRFRLSSLGPNVKLFEQNAVLAQQELIQITFTTAKPNDLNPSSVLITLTLEDANENRVTMKASAALRNHPDMLNVK